MTRPQHSFRSAAAVLVLAAGAQADTFYVDASLSIGANDGSSWADAFRGSVGLQIAFSSASSGDEIYVRAGTYRPTPGVNRESSFSLENGLEVYGGFLGTETSPGERPTIGSAPTILNGDLLDDDVLDMFDDNSYHVVNGASADSTAILDGFVINGGNANGAGINQSAGGGILCIDAADPTIRNCTFTNNRCTLTGGAVYISDGAPSFTDCQFIDNSCDDRGGAVEISGFSAVTLDRCTFTGNQAVRGGAIGLFFAEGLSVTNCLIYGNTATGNGGGGGIYSRGSSIGQIRNCTIAANTATGNKIAGVSYSSSGPPISNCIIWGNTGLGGLQLERNQTNAFLTHSIVMNAGVTSGGLNVDPLFMNPAGDDYSLRANSPAIDAGNNADLPTGLTTDVAGNPRFADVATVVDAGIGTGPIVDLGAFEAIDFFTPFCFGDGSGAQCPCGNNSLPGHMGGCGHQNGEGAILVAAGTPSVAADTMNFNLTSAAVNTFGLLVSGTNQLPQMGTCIGCGLQAFDGLRCAGGNFLRHGSRTINASGVTPNGWGPPAGPAGGLIAANGFSAGQTRNFFAYFRTELTGACGTGQNSSNGVSVTFTN